MSDAAAGGDDSSDEEEQNKKAGGDAIDEELEGESADEEDLLVPLHTGAYDDGVEDLIDIAVDDDELDQQKKQ